MGRGAFLLFFPPTFYTKREKSKSFLNKFSDFNFLVQHIQNKPLNFHEKNERNFIKKK